METIVKMVLLALAFCACHFLLPVWFPFLNQKLWEVGGHVVSYGLAMTTMIIVVGVVILMGIK
jgi:hypothetical protein